MVECLTQDRGFEPHRRHCVVSLSKNIYPSLALVQPRKTRPCLTERLLMEHKESNLTKPVDWLRMCGYLEAVFSILAPFTYMC